jgi:S1-C subfamily serine protease
MATVRGAAVALICWAVAVPGPLAAAPLPDVVERITPAIVAVGTLARIRQPPARFLGTGFAVGEGRHVITNYHVIPEDLDAKAKERLAVFVGEGKRVRAREAEVAAVDRRHDLALLRLDGAPLPTLTLGDSDRVRAGEDVAFTGFPIGMVLGLHPVTHEGIVSSVTPIATPMGSSRRLSPEVIQRLSDPFAVFQLDATAYPGNSGSPLYRPDTGRVVGVINMVFVKESKETVLEKPSGITYAIPIRFARDLLRGAR